MDMAAKFQDQLVFHMTGKRAGDGLAPIDIGALRPALLAGYRDLARLRYDFPLVLPEAADGGEYVHSLSGVVGALLDELAPRGIEGERLRKHVLRLERELRVAGRRGRDGHAVRALGARRRARQRRRRRDGRHRCSRRRAIR